jgi:hypothetical protein
MSAAENLSAEQFVSRVKKTGGATANLATGKMVNPGKRAYMVGGERDTKGQPIPADIIPAQEFGPEHVENAARKVTEATGGRARVHLGAWQDEGKVYLDASSVTKRPGEAIRKGRSRGEFEIWDNKRMRGIDTGGRG